MAIIGIGIDIISILRIKKIMHTFGNKFTQRILSKNELQEFLQDKHDMHFIAKRFAAKEATAKALGIGLQKNIYLRNIELYHDCYGKPKIMLLEKTKIFSNQLNVKSIHISITDEKKYACAVVIIE